MPNPTPPTPPVGIPDRARKKILRLSNARIDMDYSAEAFQHFQSTADKGEQYHFFLSMVMSYCGSGISELGRKIIQDFYGIAPDTKLELMTEGFKLEPPTKKP